MKRVLVKSIFDAFDYVMDHYYPYDLDNLAKQKDTYAVISIQDTHTQGFGIQFCENKYCKGVLTLYFDDTIKPVDGAILFNENHATEIINFINQHKDVDTLLIHCYAGMSRSKAVGAFAVKMLGGDNSDYFKYGSPNPYVYEILNNTWLEKLFFEALPD